MRLLFACEFYYPSVGGVQEVMRQIAERMVQAGHTVTVATSRLPGRNFKEYNGVRIEEFDIRGNRVNGIEGETKRYQEYLRQTDADAIMIKAAQQWTFDAAWPVLDQIKARKVFIPCGFSGYYLPEYQDYFRAMPDILRKFDALIFYAEHYRDIDFARHHGISNLVIIPNGASDIEFATPPDPNFRATLGIGYDDFVILTVGTPINAKGHTELATAFAHVPSSDRTLTLILNGQWPEPPAPEGIVVAAGAPTIVQRALSLLIRQGPLAFLRRALKSLDYRSRALGRALMQRLHPQPEAAQPPAAVTAVPVDIATATPERPMPPRIRDIEDWIAEARSQPGKQVLKTHFDRRDTIEAFKTANLFVFASNIEYSPLVLFEAAAAGVPFLSVPVGNAEEIARWTGGGEICPANRDAQGYTRVDPAVLAERIAALIGDPSRLVALGTQGRNAWRTTYNWHTIARRYEAVLSGATDPVDPPGSSAT